MTHHLATRNPMTEARRQHVHGRLLPMDRPEGEPSFFAGVATLFLIGVAATMLIVAFT